MKNGECMQVLACACICLNHRESRTHGKRFNGDDRVPTLNAQCGNGRQLMSSLQLQCFNMAARLAV